MKNLLTRADLEMSRKWFKLSCSSARHWVELRAIYLGLYGSQGSEISGCVRDHFPEQVKDILRNEARCVTLASNNAYKARPARVRHDTIKALGKLVAARDGAGYYGPQA